MVFQNSKVKTGDLIQYCEVVSEGPLLKVVNFEFRPSYGTEDAAGGGRRRGG
jgi:hypothetical protein